MLSMWCLCSMGQNVFHNLRVPLLSPARHASMLISPISPLPWMLTITIAPNTEGLALRLAVGASSQGQYALVSFSLGIVHPYLFSSPSLSVQPDIVLPLLPQAPVHGSSAPAMDGFGGVPLPSRGTMAAQRTSSTTRTLVCGPFSVGNHIGAWGQYPNTTSFNTQDLMVVSLADDSQGPMLPAEFSRQVQAELNTHGISFYPPPADHNPGPPGDLHSQLWVLLQASIRQGVYTLKAHPTIDDNMFSLLEFKKIKTKLPNPMAPAGRGGVPPWIPIAPQFGDLIGPVNSFSTPVKGLRSIPTKQNQNLKACVCVRGFAWQETTETQTKFFFV
ncbi:hypothetical protein B0H14DRAFT_2609492 [Mycena olivaceomarginata]|nr:hypothetical protein B0H14DRAFT_2609492 [Mycena olivaceomarginata]